MLKEGIISLLLAYLTASFHLHVSYLDLTRSFYDLYSVTTARRVALRIRPVRDWREYVFCARLGYFYLSSRWNGNC